jgi:hypothetical protein
MKTEPIAPADRIEASAIAAEIRQRPGYHLAGAWIAQRQLATLPATEHPTDVGRVGFAIELSTGARLEDETVAVALEDAGIPIIGVVRYWNGSIGGEVSIDEIVVLDVVLARNHQALPRPWARVWSDDAMENLQ